MDAITSHDHPMMDAHGSPVIAPTTYTMDGSPLLPILHRMPTEILEEVCKNLDAIWLMKLSVTCSEMRVKMSFPLGNKIWYEAMPTSLWQEKENHQDEYELAVAMAAAIEQSTFVSVKVPARSHEINSAFSKHNTSRQSTQGNQLLTPQRIGTAPTHSVFQSSLFAYDLSPIDPSLATDFPVRLSPTWAPRDNVQALGGPYNPYFNYKREIVGQLSTQQRCYICATIMGLNARAVKTKRFGMLLCNGCFDCHTISMAQLRRFVAHIRLPLERVTIFPLWQGQKILYYLPEIDNMLRDKTGTDLSAHVYYYHQGRQQMDKDRYEKSPLEIARRAVRLRLVATACRLWEGIDPMAIELVHPDTGVHIKYLSVRGAPTVETYKSFRERFAPTAKLHEFLFPAWKLVENPTALPLDKADGWLPDPSMSLKKSDCESVDNVWINSHAQGMLIALTGWHRERYNNKGAGGYVDSWVAAAKNYHLTRLGQLLKAGVTVAMSNIQAHERAGYKHYRILKWRAKAGIKTIRSSSAIAPLPSRPQRAGCIMGQSAAEYKIKHDVATKAEHERKKRIQTFNKLVRHCCVGCPLSGNLIYPPGFEAVIEHMRLNHPAVFWLSDDWNTVG